MFEDAGSACDWHGRGRLDRCREGDIQDGGHGVAAD